MSSCGPEALSPLYTTVTGITRCFCTWTAGQMDVDFANRQETFQRVWNLELALRAIPEMQGNANLIVLGDLNTMGDGSGTTGAEEIQWLVNTAPNHNMRVLTKEFDETWHQWGRGPFTNRRRLRQQDLPNALRSDLDHVIASNELQFSDLAQAPNDAPAQVFVSGWQQVQGQERIDYLWDISDHCALYVQVL